MTVLIDNGHGRDTPGKRSPDGRLLEYAYTREIADRLVAELLKRGIEAVRIVNEDFDVPISERCRRVNEYRANDALLVSIHCNAAGNGKEWTKARGFSAFVSPDASAESRKLAGCITGAAKAEGLYVRYQNHDTGYWLQNLAICRDTKCPAVLTENLFMDNKEDAGFLLSDKGKEAIVDLHINGIFEYLNA